MRHKYETRGIILSRSPLGEMSALVTVLTPELGLLRARAQSVRRSGAKLSAALATFAESSLVLVRGKEGWRVAGAVLAVSWFARIGSPASRAAAARVSGLLLRLVAGEARDSKLFPVVAGLFEALETLPEDAHDAAEILAALRILSILGFDTGAIPGGESLFTPAALAEATTNRTQYIARINRGITASEL